MENVMNMMHDKTGIAASQAKDAVTHAVDYVKDNLPLLGTGLLATVKGHKLLTTGVLLGLGLGAYFGYMRMKKNGRSSQAFSSPNYPYQA